MPGVTGLARHQGYMEGAVKSGERAAAEIVTALGGRLGHQVAATSGR
jgi:hypothetical protein